MKSSLIATTLAAVMTVTTPAFAGSSSWTYIPHLTFPTDQDTETTKNCLNPAVLTDANCLSDTE